MTSRPSYLNPRQSTIYGPSLGGGGINSNGNGNTNMAPPSQYSNNAGMVTSGSSSARLVAKQSELEGLRLLKEQSSRMVREMEKLSEKVDVLVQGGEAAANVLSSWQGVFRAIQIAKSSVSFPSSAGGEDGRRRKGKTRKVVVVKKVVVRKKKKKATTTGETVEEEEGEGEEEGVEEEIEEEVEEEVEEDATDQDQDQSDQEEEETFAIREVPDTLVRIPIEIENHVLGSVDPN